MAVLPLRCYPGLTVLMTVLLLQLLLEVYEPLLVSRAKRAQSSHADYRELLSAARQGLLRAAARFDAGRVGGGVRGARLAALADRYIKNALRDVLTEVSLGRAGSAHGQNLGLHLPSLQHDGARVHANPCMAQCFCQSPCA